MQDRPTATELLDAIAEFLIRDVAPNVPNWLTFQVRVASNSLGIIKREIDLEASHMEEEWSSLGNLLGHRDADNAGTRDAIRIANQELCERIRDGQFDTPMERKKLLEHLHATVRNKLAVSSPRALQQ